jgi:hypothetical protein
MYMRQNWADVAGSSPFATSEIGGVVWDPARVPK